MTSAFTETDTAEIDSGMEFVFTNLAMMVERARQEKDQQAEQRQFVVVPHFCSAAATSLEKFATMLRELVQTMKIPVDIGTYHPEHVDASKRAPVPVVLLQWKSSS